MIPTYSSEKTQKMRIVVAHLDLLNSYDFTEPHRHDYFEFFYFQKGGGIHSIDFKSFDIKDNSVHIVAPGQIHQVKRELDSEGYVILFELGAIESPKAIEEFLFEHICLDAGELNPTYHLKSEEKDIHLNRSQELFSAFLLDSDYSKLKMINLLHSFCIACMEASVRKNDQINNDYLLFRKHLKNHFTTIKKVKEYAEMMHISERSLNDLVKKNTGKSTSEVIYERIVMESKRLLRTGISVKETAYSLNFDDPAHFSKFFKTQTGQSPRDFQNCT